MAVSSLPSGEVISRHHSSNGILKNIGILTTKWGGNFETLALTAFSTGLSAGTYPHYQVSDT